jgi:hypothetical protein
MAARHGDVTMLRRIAFAGALLALAIIGARPSWHVGAPARDAILRTPGADPQATRRLADSLGGASGGGGAPIFSDLAEVREHRSSIRRLHIVGWGLDADNWTGLDSIPIVMHPAAVPPGISRVAWPAAVALGDHLEVDGTVAAVAARSRVELSDPTSVVDSTQADSTGAFHLEAVPKAVGRLLYVLRTGSAPPETLGVAVIPPPAWRVLILESAPRAETTVLRDWLAARHGAIAIRSAISRERFHRAFVNRDSVSLDLLTGTLLSRFDAVVSDGRTLAGLSAVERTALRKAVESEGLGVLVVPDTVVTDGGTTRFSDREFFLDFRLQHVGTLDERLVKPVWEGQRASASAAIPAEPYTLVDRFGTETLVGDGLGNTLAQVAPRGAGRVALSLVTGSARWRRAGLSDTYASYWSRLLAAIADPNRDDVRWSIAPAGPWTVHRPVIIEAATRRAMSVALIAGPTGEPDSVYLARDTTGSGQWKGIFWPRSPGWHSIGGVGGPSFYVQAITGWTSARATARLVASARAMVGMVGGEGSARAPAAPTRPVPLGWPFALFLLSAGYLWAERRRAAAPPTGSPADTGT